MSEKSTQNFTEKIKIDFITRKATFPPKKMEKSLDNKMDTNQLVDLDERTIACL